ncbi:hypothetical protein ACFSYD_00375 [Paracoccus aerius]
MRYDQGPCRPSRCPGLHRPTPAPAQEWRAQVTPYVWATGLGGDITPFTGAPTLSFEKSFSDVLEDLDAAFFLSAYARRDRFVLLGDLSYAASSKSGLVPRGLPAEAELRQRSLTVAAGWRAIDSGGLALDVLGGLRAWTIKAEISVAGARSAGRGTRISSTRSWRCGPITRLPPDGPLSPISTMASPGSAPTRPRRSWRPSITRWRNGPIFPWATGGWTWTTAAAGRGWMPRWQARFWA